MYAGFAAVQRGRCSLLTFVSLTIANDSRPVEGPAYIMRSKVSHASRLPVLNPVRNHSTRCAEEPWVNDSGCTPRHAAADRIHLEVKAR
jgi:hypothetical protein